jgi:hypothetical protein
MGGTTEDANQPNSSLTKSAYLKSFGTVSIMSGPLQVPQLHHVHVPYFHSIFFIRVLFPVSYFLVLAHASCSWCPPDHFGQQTDQQFQQKTDRFWEFNEQTNSWVEVELPYDLISCVNDNCTKVGSISPILETEYDIVPEQRESLQKKDGHGGQEENSNTVVLPQRKRISLTKMSETSIWVTGESGSIYERFWNGVQWVIAPHDLQVLAGHAISVFIVNQTILALSESGILYQVLQSTSCLKNLYQITYYGIT